MTTAAVRFEGITKRFPGVLANDKVNFDLRPGEVHALVGEMDEAFAWLDRVDQWALPSLVSLNNSARFAPLRADPRFERIRARLGMP